MAAKKPTARKKTTTTTRRKTVKRTSTVRKPRGGTRGQKAATWMALHLAAAAEKHTITVTSRKDAAILRETHEGCPRCKGNGQIFTQGKDGAFTGSKPCPAKPTKAKASRLRVALSSRFGPDRSSGLIGWTCPCGTKEKPRYRDAKTATAAMRTHERKKHGGKGVGGAWYAVVTEGTQPTGKPTAPSTPVSKVDASSNMTDAEWEKQNTPLSPKAAQAKGVCWCCGGQGALYSAFGGERITTVCTPCQGTGKASAAATSHA